MRRPGSVGLGLVLIASSAWAAAAASPASETSRPREAVEIYFAVASEVDSWRIEAELVAGGRLLLGAEAAASGPEVWVLEEVVEAPWKLYWVDPVGPGNEESKVASVLTLEEGSWESLAAAREAHAELGRRQYDAYRDDRWSAFDGAFEFIVIGKPRGGFGVTVNGEGRVAGVSNRLTRRWLPGPFDSWVGRWPTEPLGYWFWNRGEAEPFAWEPHTYHGFEAALALLGLGPEVTSGELLAASRTVLRTLAPRLGDGPAGDPELRAMERSLDGGGVETRLEGGGLSARRLRRREGGRWRSDEWEVRWADPGGRLHLRVGWRRVDGAPRAVGPGQR